MIRTVALRAGGFAMIDSLMNTVCDQDRRGADSLSDRFKRISQSTPPSLIAGVALLSALFVAIYFRTFVELIGRWSHEDQYAHGFLVPLISAWLLWRRRTLIASVAEPVRGRWLGVAFLVSSAVLRLLAVYFNFVLVEPVSLIVCIAGVAVLIGGFSALRWAWPAIVFLFFMVPLPGFLAGRLSGPLQHVATLCSTYLLQTLGVPAIAVGNVIWLSHGSIGVVEACNGLGMFMLFVAVTTAAVFLLNITNCEKLCLLVSSLGIAVVANVMRITATGVAHELVGPQLADRIFHDLAGWIMMPLALLMLGLEVFLLSKLFPKVPTRSPAVARNAAGSIKPLKPLGNP